MNNLNTTVSFIVPQQERKKQKMRRYGDKFGHKVFENLLSFILIIRKIWKFKF